MPTRTATSASREPDAITLGTATWLAGGIVLYGLTPLPLRDAALGWSMPFWLLVAPALILALRQLAAMAGRQGRQPRRAARRGRPAQPPAR